MAKQQADVWLTPEELRLLGKKNQSCTKIDASILEPAQCSSQMGRSSAMMFGGRKPEPGGKNNNLTTAEYAVMLEKYYGKGSLMNKMLAQSAAIRDGGAGEEVDREINRRAVRETRAKYLTPALAGRYGVDVPGVTGPTPASPALLGLTMVPTARAGGMPKELTTGAQDVGSAQKVMDMAAALAEAERARSRAAQAAIRKKEEARQAALLARANAPRPASANFRAPSREQASRTGSHFVNPGREAPGPGKYQVRYGLMEKHCPGTHLVPSSYGAEIRAALQQRQPHQQHPGADADPESEAHTSDPWQHQQHHHHSPSASPQHGRPVSASPTGRHTPRQGTASARPRHNHPDHPDRTGSGSPQRPASAPRPGGASGVASGVASGDNSRPRSARNSDPSATQQRASLFKDAHRVHDRPGSRPGSSSFKAIPRPAPANDTPGAHLALKYFREDYDALQRKAQHLLLDFGPRPARPEPGSELEGAGAALGPGCYIGAHNLPGSYTGKHLAAGHKGHTQHTQDFNKVSARPGSARPPPRPGTAPAAAGHHGRPVSAVVTPQEAQAALHSMFDPELDPSDLLSIQALQHHQRQQQQQMQRHQAHEPPPDPLQPPEQAAAQQHGDLGPGQHVGPEEVARFGSSGLSSRVRGGYMSRTTRDEEILGLRVLGDGRVTPPASAPLARCRPQQGADATYEAEDSAQGHRRRSPSWALPPNRAALSKQWVSAAALAYL